MSLGGVVFAVTSFCLGFGRPCLKAWIGVRPFIFRHGDGNVLASVLPVLDESQFARLFGPAPALTFHAPGLQDKDGWPVRRRKLRRKHPHCLGQHLKHRRRLRHDLAVHID
jgi:hypothetical protein